MKKNRVVHAWRNADEHHKLSADEKIGLPENPAALPSIDDDVLKSISGGCGGPTSAFCTPCPPRWCY